MRIAPVSAPNINTWDGTEHNDAPPTNYERVLTHTGNGTVPVAPHEPIVGSYAGVVHAPRLWQLSDYLDQIYGE